MDVRHLRLAPLRDDVPLDPGPIEEGLLRDVVLGLARDDASGASDALVHVDAESPELLRRLLRRRCGPCGDRLEDPSEDAAGQDEEGEKLPDERPAIHFSTSGRWG